MAKTIAFEEDAATLGTRVGSLRDSLQGLDTALRTAEAGAKRTAASTQNLRAAFVHAAAPLTETLNPALAELDTLTGALGSRSGVAKTAAGLDQVEQAAAAAAKTTAKAVHSLAGFDEIIRMGAVSETASKSSSGSSGKKSSGSSSKKTAEKAAAEAETPVQSLLSRLKEALAAFWAYVQQYYAPAILAWGAAWNRMKEAALAVWEPVKNAALSLWQNTLVPLGNYLLTQFVPGIVNSFSLALWPVVGQLGAATITALGNTFVWLAGVVQQAMDGVVRPALENALAIWSTMMQAIYNAWQVYGQPIYDGIIAAADNLCAVLDALWTGTVLPLLQGLVGQLNTLWQESLVPLFSDLMMLLGSVGQLLLTLWNQAIAPLLQWLVTAFGPAVSQVCLLVSGAVTTAVGVVAGLISTLLTALQGLADFLSDVLCGRWSDAWNDMADTAARVWERITTTVSNAINGIKELVSGFASGIVDAVKGALSALDSLKDRASAGTYKVGKAEAESRALPYNALPSLPDAGTLRVPALARGAVIPPNREFLAVLGDQRSGTNVEAPLATIQQAVAAVMQDMSDGELAALQQVVATLRQILEAVYGIHVGDEVIGRAAERYRMRRAVMTGGGFV